MAAVPRFPTELTFALAAICGCSAAGPVPARGAAPGPPEPPAPEARPPEPPASCPSGTARIEGVGEGAAGVETFCLDVHEVTALAYARCVAEGGPCEPLYMPPIYDDRQIGTFGDPALAMHPMNYVTAGEAEAFCRWAGKRLPTEDEMLRASGGGTAARPHPWGDAPADDTRICGDGADGVITCPVGSRPDGASTEGVLGLEGNVAEWTASAMGDRRVLFGAGAVDPASRIAWVGFRCAARPGSIVREGLDAEGGFPDVPPRPPPPVPGCDGRDEDVTPTVAVLLREDAEELGRTGDEDSWGIDLGGDSLLWPYTPTGECDPCGGGQVFVGEGQGDDGVLRFPCLESLTAERASQTGIRGDAVLLSFVANCGRAPAGGQGVVMSRIVRVDDTDEYPLDVAEIVRRLKARARSWITDHDDEVRSMLRGERRTLGEGVEGSGGWFTPAEVRLTTRARWDGEALHVSVAVRDVQYWMTRGYCGGAYREPEESDVCLLGEVGVEVAFRWTVDREGEIVESESDPPTSWGARSPPMP